MLYTSNLFVFDRLQWFNEQAEIHLGDFPFIVRHLDWVFRGPNKLMYVGANFSWQCVSCLLAIGFEEQAWIITLRYPLGQNIHGICE